MTNVQIYDIKSEPCRIEFSELYQSIKSDAERPQWSENPCTKKPSLLSICNSKKRKVKQAQSYTHNQRRWQSIYKYQCPDCEFKTQKKGELSCHRKKMHGYKCSMCEAILNCNRALDRHVLGVHDQIKVAQCPYCDKSFDTPQNCRRHQKIVHFGLKEYCCKICGYRCSSAQNMTLHIRRNHNKTKDFQCQFCDFRTHAKPNLLKHQKTMHINRVEYTCNICFFSCRSSELLERHKATKYHQRNVKNYSHLCYQFELEEDVNNINKKNK